MFTTSFKYYKSKCPPPSFDSVIDFNEIDENLCVRRTITDNGDEQYKSFGLSSPKLWQIYQFPSGLILIKNPFTALGQRYWIARCLRDYPKSPHVNNLRSKSISPSVIEDWWTELTNCQTPTEKQRLRSALRWCTLGYHHQWDTKVYSEDMKHSFPMDLGSLSAYLAGILDFEKYSAEAAIVNFYPIGTTLAGHTDHSERNLDAPLFSYSFGQPAIFLIGGTTKDIEPTAMFLRSGDILIMSKESRLCYHAVPRVFKSDESVAWNSIVKDNDDDAIGMPKRRKIDHDSGCMNAELWQSVEDRFFWEPFNEYVEDCRINANVRSNMSLLKRITVTYGTFVTANYMSNHILFPDKKLDYGFLNRLIGREVNTEWWGTRSAHIFTIGLPLAIADHLSIDLWNKVLLPRLKYPAGTKLSIRSTPGPFLFHDVTFAFTGIMTYIAWDSYANPYHKERVQAFTSKAYPELQGCQSMYMLPLMSGAVEYMSGRPCPHGTLLGLIPPTAAFVTVKGFGMKWPWNDNLTNFERKLNGQSQ